MREILLKTLQLLDGHPLTFERLVIDGKFRTEYDCLGVLRVLQDIDAIFESNGEYRTSNLGKQLIVCWVSPSKLEAEMENHPKEKDVGTSESALHHTNGRNQDLSFGKLGSKIGLEAQKLPRRTKRVTEDEIFGFTLAHTCIDIDMIRHKVTYDHVRLHGYT